MLRMPKLRTATYANVTSTLALVLALGGTSYAAVVLADGQVKTRHIAANAVKTGKIANSTILTGDLSAGARQRVWTSVFDFPGGAGTIITGNTTLHTLTVPAGTYLVTSAVELNSDTSVVNGLICDMDGGDEGERYVGSSAAGITSLGGQFLVRRTTAGDITLKCFRFSSEGAGVVTRRHSSLTALKVHAAYNVAP